jgi:hypothetical protein
MAPSSSLAAGATCPTKRRLPLAFYSAPSVHIAVQPVNNGVFPHPGQESGYLTLSSCLSTKVRSSRNFEGRPIGARYTSLPGKGKVEHKQKLLWMGVVWKALPYGEYFL